MTQDDPDGAKASNWRGSEEATCPSDDPIEAPAFKKLVRRFLETPPKPHEEMKIGKPRRGKVKQPQGITEKAPESR